MNIVEYNWTNFNEAILQKKPIHIDAKGHLLVEGFLERLFRLIRNNDSERLQEITSFFSKALDKNEESQNTSREVFEITAQNIEQHFVDFGFKNNHPYLGLIKRKILALRYREGIEDTVHFNREWLEAKALKWKQDQVFFGKNTVLTEQNLKRLRESLVYPSFLRLLEEDKKLRSQFFLWTLRDNLNSSLLIEFPYHAKLLKESFITKRVSRLGHHLLIIQKKGNKKEISLLIEGSYVSILDKSKIISFGKSYQLTLEKIFKIFAEKRVEPGDLEIFGTKGLIPWRAYTREFYNSQTDKWEKISLTEKFWWKKLPIFELLSTKALKKRYKLKDINENYSLFVLCSTRESEKEELMGNHSYYKIITYDKEKGFWLVMPFGKYPCKFPMRKRVEGRISKFLEEIKYFFNKLTFYASRREGTISFPDENVFMLQREHLAKSFLLTPQEKDLLLEALKEELLKIDRRESNFQFGSENCAKHVIIVFRSFDKETKLPFKKPFFSLEFGGRIGKIFRYGVSFLSEINKMRVLKCIGKILRADDLFLTKLVQNEGKVFYPAAPFFEKKDEEERPNQRQVIGYRKYFGSPL